MAVVKMYGNTGFNSVDVPDSPKLIEENFEPIKEYDEINVIQNEYLAYIIVDDISPAEARKIDYIIIEEEDKSCYTVERYEFKADETCKFYLILDAYNTMGGFNEGSGNIVVSGTANRMSVPLTEDDSRFFTLDEPFKPAEKSKIEFLQPFANSNDSISLIEVIAIPPKIVEPVYYTGVSTKSGIQIQSPSNIQKNINGCGVGQQMIEQEQGSGDSKVSSITFALSTSPMLRKLVQTTLSILNPFNSSARSIKTGSRWFDSNKISYAISIEKQGTVTGDLIQDFREQGMDNNVVAYWEVPTRFITATSNPYQPDKESDSEYGGITNASCKVENATLTITHFQKIYNNKARYGQSIVLKLFNGASGAQLDKYIHEVANIGTLPNAESYPVDVVQGADIRPDGYPIGAFRYINQVSQGEVLCEVLNGANWRQVPLVASGLSGEYQTQRNISRQYNREQGFNIAKIVGSVGALVGGIGLTVATGGAGSVAGAGLIQAGTTGIFANTKNYISNSIQQKDQQAQLQQEAVSSATQLEVGNSSLARDTGHNIFYVLKSTYSDSDLIAFDTFLTKYGYNVGNKWIDNGYFYSRPAFNFMRINDITIVSQTASLSLLELVKQQLQAGIRIWHKKPNITDMTAGGNRGE